MVLRDRKWLCSKHYLEQREKNGEVWVYTINNLFNAFTCSKCGEEALHLVDVENTEESHASTS